MKILLLSLFLGVAYAKVVTDVTAKYDQIVVGTGGRVTIPCEFSVQSTDDQPPIIFWIKGTTVDDPNAEVIFKGYKYWNETHGEYRQFFGEYEDRATVVDLTEPTIEISNMGVDDEGRYWCMVAEWSGRQQEGNDADSTAVMVDLRKSVISVSTVDNVTIEEGSDAFMACSILGTYDTITWLQGPFHNSDTNNFTHTEIGTYKKLGTQYTFNKCDENGLNCQPGTVMEPSTNANYGIDTKGRLYIQSAVIANSGRYWCEATIHTASNVQLQTDRSSLQLIVNGPDFTCEGKAPGLYPDPEDCSMYYECVAGNPITYHRSCGYDGLVFDESNGYCDWAANVPPPCGTNNNGIQA